MHVGYFVSISRLCSPVIVLYDIILYTVIKKCSNIFIITRVDEMIKIRTDNTVYNNKISIKWVHVLIYFELEKKNLLTRGFCLHYLPCS